MRIRRSKAQPTAPEVAVAGAVATEGGDVGHPGHAPAEAVGRRAMLRRVATVAAAGIGGVAAVEVLGASPASAAAGDNLVLGQSNNGGAGASTTLTSTSSSGSSLTLVHANDLAPLRLTDSGATADFSDSAGVFQGGELVNLIETVTDPSSGTQTQADTLFWMAGADADAQLENLAVVLTTATGTVFAPVGPDRVLDTRTTSLRTLIVDQSVLDSSHRLIGGHFLELALDSFVQNAYAVHFNITATSETAGGYLTVWGSGTRPTASNLNYQKGVSIANHGVCALSANLSIFIYASKTTHVILDVQGWTLPDFSFLNTNGSDIAPAAASAAPLARARYVRKLPRRTTR